MYISVQRKLLELAAGMAQALPLAIKKTKN
jgi:hypothetical protein